MTANIPSRKILNKIIQRIVATADPEQIIMFGSAARGQMRRDSDIDLLVVKRGSYNPRTIAAEIYMNLYGVGQAVDIIVATPEQLDQYKDSPLMVVFPALREGRIIYDARPVPA